MDPQFAILIIAVFAAATLQSATGIGFGIIAGPILLAFMNDASAIQISIVLNLLIAVLLAPSVWRKFDAQVLPNFAIGIAIGSPLGFVVFSILPLIYLKLLAAVFVLFALVTLLFGERLVFRDSKAAPGKLEQITVGAVAGVMGSSLAMPGPVPAAWMSARGFNKNTVRATIIIMFVVAYFVALLLQILNVGIDRETMERCLDLALPTIGGIVLGKLLSERISERTFRTILTVVLMATSATLLASIRA